MKEFEFDHADVAKIGRVYVFNGQPIADVAWRHVTGVYVVTNGHPEQPFLAYLLGRAEQQGVPFQRLNPQPWPPKPFNTAVLDG